jgi:hypothetical protein
MYIKKRRPRNKFKSCNSLEPLCYLKARGMKYSIFHIFVKSVYTGTKSQSNYYEENPIQ